MAKRQHSVGLSFVLFRFAMIMLGCMLLCCLLWYAVLRLLLNSGVIYHGSVSNQQVEQMLGKDPKTFVTPGEDFLAGYALFGPEGEVLKSNTEGRKLEALVGYLQEEVNDIHVLRHTYADGSTIIIRWQYRAEFVNPVLRAMLPPFEYLWLALLGVSWALCLLVNILWLRRHLTAKLRLFGEVSERIGAQELDFKIPHAGIREYDRALEAMEQMREALYLSLSSQWAAQQKREAEIKALAHDLKTPLTLTGGNAELLLEEELPGRSRKMVETIVASNDRARQYVASLLETSAGADESFEYTDLPAMFDELCRNMAAVAEAGRVCLQSKNELAGHACIQRERILRALGNVVQNAIEHTGAGRDVYLEGRMAEGGWLVSVRDEGPGFSNAALHHATERLWRGNAARGADGHNGLGLWFAGQVVKAHAGQLILSNCNSGGMVSIRFRFQSR